MMWVFNHGAAFDLPETKELLPATGNKSTKRKIVSRSSTDSQRGARRGRFFHQGKLPAPCESLTDPLTGKKKPFFLGQLGMILDRNGFWL